MSGLLFCSLLPASHDLPYPLSDNVFMVILLRNAQCSTTLSIPFFSYFLFTAFRVFFSESATDM